MYSLQWRMHIASLSFLIFSATIDPDEAYCLAHYNHWLCLSTRDGQVSLLSVLSITDVPFPLKIYRHIPARDHLTFCSCPHIFFLARTVNWRRGYCRCWRRFCMNVVSRALRSYEFTLIVWRKVEEHLSDHLDCEAVPLYLTHSSIALN